MKSQVFAQCVWKTQKPVPPLSMTVPYPDGRDVSNIMSFTHLASPDYTHSTHGSPQCI
jgi:hypothetical protein